MVLLEEKHKEKLRKQNLDSFDCIVPLHFFFENILIYLQHNKWWIIKNMSRDGFYKWEKKAVKKDYFFQVTVDLFMINQTIIIHLGLPAVQSSYVSTWTNIW